jgi:signal transduction histidine kinase
LVLETNRDITERKQAEQERERSLLLEHALRVEAERAARAKDEFLATVSHELRTPLNAILGWATMLRKSSLDDVTASRGMEAIERNATAQAHLVEDLLDASRIISGNLRLDVKPISFIR